MDAQDREALLAESLKAALQREQELGAQIEQLRKHPPKRMFVIEVEHKLTIGQLQMLAHLANEHLPGEVMLMDDGMKIHELTGHLEGADLARSALSLAKRALFLALCLLVAFLVRIWFS